MDTKQAIQSRYACRSFEDKQITDSQRDTLIAAAKAAPVAMGDYSTVTLTVIQNETIRAKIDQETAHAMPMMGEHPTYQAPTLFLISAKENAQFPAIPYSNASCIAENIMIQATALELASVYIMAVPTVMQQKPELLREFGIPSDFFPAVMVAVGKASELASHEKTEHQLLTKIL